MSAEEFCTLIGDCSNTENNSTGNSRINHQNKDINTKPNTTATSLETDIDRQLNQCHLTEHNGMNENKENLKQIPTEVGVNPSRSSTNDNKADKSIDAGSNTDIGRCNTNKYEESDDNTKQISSQKQCTLIGLHTCGDLASTMLKLFKRTEHIKNIVSVSCCYFRMTLKSEIESGNTEMRNRDNNKHTACCDKTPTTNHSSTRLRYCDFSLETLHFNMKVLDEQTVYTTNNNEQNNRVGVCSTMNEETINSGIHDGIVYGFPLSDFIHRIPVAPLKYKSFETACHFLGDYADKLMGQLLFFFFIREVKQSPLDDDSERKLPALSPQNEMINLEF